MCRELWNVRILALDWIGVHFDRFVHFAMSRPLRVIWSGMVELMSAFGMKRYEVRSHVSQSAASISRASAGYLHPKSTPNG